MAEGLNIWHCLPRQALPEVDREHEPNQQLSEELLGMVFDEIDEYGGFTSGEIPIDNTQKYILERTGRHQLAGGGYDDGSSAYSSDDDGDGSSKSKRKAKANELANARSLADTREHSAEELLSGGESFYGIQFEYKTSKQANEQASKTNKQKRETDREERRA